MAGASDLAGARVLVVEDEMLVSLLIEDILTDSKCIIVGPYDRVPAALEAARTLALDAAVLDVNLAGTKVYPVAEMLSARGIPFVLLSGYGAGSRASRACVLASVQQAVQARATHRDARRANRLTTST